MTISQEDLEKIAHLAYLGADDPVEPSNPSQLRQDISSIMDFVEQLRSVDTKHIAPLFHPLALHQPLRADIITEADCLAELEAMAPLFENHLYLVPKVLESSSS